MELNDYQSGSKQVCVSLSLSDYIWMKKAGFSPSRVLRKAINDLQNNKSHDDLKELSLNVKKQADIIQNAMDFLEREGKSDAFFEFQEKKEIDELKRKKNREIIVKDVEKEVKEVLGDKE